MFWWGASNECHNIFFWEKSEKYHYFLVGKSFSSRGMLMHQNQLKKSTRISFIGAVTSKSKPDLSYKMCRHILVYTSVQSHQVQSHWEFIFHKYIYTKYLVAFSLIMLNKLRCHNHFYCQPMRLLNPDSWYKFTYWITNSVDPDQLASSEANCLDLHCL